MLGEVALDGGLQVDDRMEATSGTVGPLEAYDCLSADRGVRRAEIENNLTHRRRTGSGRQASIDAMTGWAATGYQTRKLEIQGYRILRKTPAIVHPPPGETALARVNSF